MDLSVVTVLPSLKAVGSWEEVLLFSIDFTVSQNLLELELHEANFCISRGLFDAMAVRHRMFLCWSRAVRSGVNQGLCLFLVLHFLKGACLFKMVRKILLKKDQASSTDGMRSISFQDTRARSIRKACSQKCFRER